MPLPTPKGRQCEVLYLPAEGHAAILGTAGSGKTILAILRAAYLADTRLPHSGRVLLVTYNKTLTTYLRYLQPKSSSLITIENYHKFARGYLASRGRMSRWAICPPSHRKAFIEEAIKKVAEKYRHNDFFEKPIDLFSEEIRWILQSGLTSLDEYRSIDRVGRSDVRVSQPFREVMFQIHLQYRKLRADAGYEHDWEDIASAVTKELVADSRPRLYKHVIIDEGQDFSPEMIRSLAKAIPPDGSLTFFGDVAQQIYGHRISWRSAGLQILEPWEFKENYRNSPQIARLAIAITQMPYYSGVVEDLVIPTTTTAAGPLPTIVSCQTTDEEIELIVSRAAAFAKTKTVGILVSKKEDEERVRVGLRSIRATHLNKELQRWTGNVGIYYGTYHSAKGLEFDTVILPMLTSDRLPPLSDIEAHGLDDAQCRAGRRLYVGVTRAKQDLILTYCGVLTDLLPTDPSLYTRPKI